EGHSDEVNSVAFSPGGDHLTSGSDDRTIRVWDSRTGEMVAGPFSGHARLIWSVAFSPDGRSIASGSEDGTVRLWKESSMASPTLKNPLSFRKWQSRIAGDGWVCGSSGELLMWVPEVHRAGLYFLGNACVAGVHVTELDLDRSVH
ncbi:WD40-repeat-containing domain protein, partial [Gloeopeniophorella convolvens]